MTLKEMRKSKGMTQSQVAEALGVSQASVVKWEHGIIPNGRFILPLSKLFGVDLNSLLDIHSVNINSTSTIREKLLETLSKTPIIDLQSLIYDLTEKDINMDNVIILKYQLYPKTDCGDKTFGFEVSGDFMVSDGVSFTPGVLMFCDPSKLAVSNDFVVAQLRTNNYKIFAQYIDYCGRPALQYLNKKYPIIIEPFDIIGKITGFYKDL